MTLSVTRAADRKAMAAQLKRLATENGWNCEANESTYDPRAIRVQVSGPGGLSVHLRLDGASRAGAFVLSWCVSGSNRLTKAFENRIGPVNAHHRAKATTCVNTWPGVVETVREGMVMATDGKAFE